MQNKQRNTHRIENKQVIPNARNQIRSNESSSATRILSIVDPMSINMDLVAFFISIAPPNQQMRFIDMINAYVELAKNSEHAGISMWANTIGK